MIWNSQQFQKYAVFWRIVFFLQRYYAKCISSQRKIACSVRSLPYQYDQMLFLACKEGIWIFQITRTIIIKTD